MGFLEFLGVLFIVVILIIYWGICSIGYGTDVRDRGLRWCFPPVALNFVWSKIF